MAGWLARRATAVPLQMDYPRLSERVGLAVRRFLMLNCRLSLTKAIMRIGNRDDRVAVGTVDVGVVVLHAVLRNTRRPRLPAYNGCAELCPELTGQIPGSAAHFRLFPRSRLQCVLMNPL
jgi:hypothetical protein